MDEIAGLIAGAALPLWRGFCLLMRGPVSILVDVLVFLGDLTQLLARGRAMRGRTAPEEHPEDRAAPGGFLHGARTVGDATPGERAGWG